MFVHDTPFAIYRQYYTAECRKDDRDRSYLEIAVEPAAGDQRLNPIPFDHGILQPSLLGLHILDYNFAEGDLIRFAVTCENGDRVPIPAWRGGERGTLNAER